LISAAARRPLVRNALPRYIFCYWPFSDLPVKDYVHLNAKGNDIVTDELEHYLMGRLGQDIKSGAIMFKH